MINQLIIVLTMSVMAKLNLSYITEMDQSFDSHCPCWCVQSVASFIFCKIRLLLLGPSDTLQKDQARHGPNSSVTGWMHHVPCIAVCLEDVDRNPSGGLSCQSRKLRIFTSLRRRVTLSNQLELEANCISFFLAKIMLGGCLDAVCGGCCLSLVAAVV